MPGLTIRFRLILLSVVLMLGIFGTNLYLTRALDRASAAANQSDRLVALIGTVDTVRTRFGELRYWLTDLSVSMLTQSERNVTAARIALAAGIWTLRQNEPVAAAEIAGDAAQFDTAAMQAVEAYTGDQRVVGNSLTSQARAHGQRVDVVLDRLSDDLSNQAHAAGELVRDSAAAAQSVSTAVVLAAVLAGAGLTALVLRSILLPLRRLVTAVEGVSRGDDTVILPPPCPPASSRWASAAWSRGKDRATRTDSFPASASSTRASRSAWSRRAKTWMVRGCSFEPATEAQLP